VNPKKKYSNERQFFFGVCSFVLDVFNLDRFAEVSLRKSFVAFYSYLLDCESFSDLERTANGFIE
jgi:hypothetical protein